MCGGGHRRVYDLLRFFEDAAQVIRPAKALSVNLVDVLGP